MVMMAWSGGRPGLSHAQTSPAAMAPATVEKNNSGPLADKPLAAFRVNLLDLAFQAASEIPVDPHIKDRSRAQEAVVATCLRLQQPNRAVKYTEMIKDWRRGACYADVAFYYAQQNVAETARVYLDMAGKVSGNPQLEKWRRDRIRAKMARSYVLLGEPQQAEQFVKNVVSSESGNLLGLASPKDDPPTSAEALKALQTSVAKGDLDVIRNTLTASIRVYEQVYSDAAQRNALEQAIRDSWGKCPIFLRVDLQLHLARVALGKGDTAHARELIDAAQKLVDGATWPVDYYIPLLGNLAELHGLVGAKDYSAATVRQAMDLFEREKTKIIDIDWAQTLRPLAVASVAAGNHAQALQIYKLAVEAGMHNPNSRPRALDLSATCLDMSINALEPDAALWSRLHEIRKGLTQPW